MKPQLDRVYGTRMFVESPYLLRRDVQRITDGRRGKVKVVCPRSKVTTAASNNRHPTTTCSNNIRSRTTGSISITAKERSNVSRIVTLTYMNVHGKWWRLCCHENGRSKMSPSITTQFCLSLYIT